MANVKITELTALTTPADDDALVIVDDSEASLEQTKRITWANLKAALTGASATYVTTGAYTASFPTNGVAASSIIMLGTSSTIIWMYLNTAPPGWKALSTGADTVIGVSGGSNSFNVNGGNPDSSAVWAITGLTANWHTHEGSSHTHSVTIPISGYGGTAGGGPNAGYLQTDNAGNLYYATTQPIATSGTASTANTGGPSTRVVTSAGTWRPKASIGKLFQLDTA